MIFLPSGTRIWLVAGVTDMRKSFNGLGELVQHALDENPFSGHLFIFRGCKGDTVKSLWADADNLCLFTKRLAVFRALRNAGISPLHSHPVRTWPETLYERPLMPVLISYPDRHLSPFPTVTYRKNILAPVNEIPVSLPAQPQKRS